MATTRGGGPTEPQSEDDATGVVDLSYSDAGAELDAIIQEFETGVIDVDRLVDQLQRATDIVDELDLRLRQTRMRVEELVPRLEAIGQSDGAVPEDIEAELEDGPPPEVQDGDEEPPPGLF
jgi:exodeoxyribonuclease VII small subunit